MRNECSILSTTATSAKAKKAGAKSANGKAVTEGDIIVDVHPLGYWASLELLLITRLYIFMGVLSSTVRSQSFERELLRPVCC